MELALIIAEQVDGLRDEYWIQLDPEMSRGLWMNSCAGPARTESPGSALAARPGRPPRPEQDERSRV
ncbi:MAG: hypothetical protein U5R48_11210, partial [Gammaproteobacteria bacterium]|nr:hypothetical protein [Gammaproteobacteria bacterium]